MYKMVDGQQLSTCHVPSAHHNAYTQLHIHSVSAMLFYFRSGQMRATFHIVALYILVPLAAVWHEEE
jgi:hypothetical protein